MREGGRQDCISCCLYPVLCLHYHPNTSLSSIQSQLCRCQRQGKLQGEEEEGGREEDCVEEREGEIGCKPSWYGRIYLSSSCYFPCSTQSTCQSMEGRPQGVGMPWSASYQLPELMPVIN